MTLRGRLTVALLTLGIAGGVAQWWSARSPSPPAVGADRDPLAAQPGPAPIEFLRHLPASAAAVAALEPAFGSGKNDLGHSRLFVIRVGWAFLDETSQPT